MASFDLNTPLDDMELKFISRKLGLCDCIILSESLCIGTPLEDLVRQYQENKYAPSEMLNTWNSNQDPAKGRRLMIQALEDSGLTSLAETVRLGDQHHATGNAVASNLNMGVVKLARQYEENADPHSETLNTWHSNQDQAKERGSQKETFKENTLDCLAAEKVQMGGCHTVPQGMSTDQHHATGNAVVSNLNMGMALFDPNTPLDDLELKSVSKQPGPQEWLKLSTSSETTVVKLAREYKEKADAPSEILITWPSNQDPAKEIRLMINSSGAFLDCLAEKDQMRIGERRALQPSSAQHPSRPRKRRRPKILQQPDIAPKRIRQQTSFEITEIKLRDISNKLGRDWRMVGTYLGFNNSQIEVMLEEYRDVKECIFQMLLQWQKTNGVKATKEKFKKALRRSQREDLADFIDEADDQVLAN